MIAVTPEKVPSGTVSVQLWKRPEQSVRAERRDKPIEEKENCCRIEGWQAACDIQALAPDTLIVSTGDRESDIYGFSGGMSDYAPAQRAAWIIRAAQNRCLEIKESDTARKLPEKLRQAPILGEMQFTVPAQNGKPARPVRQAVHAAAVTLQPPERRGIKGFKLPTVTINAVFAEEINPPENQEPVNWLLLTCLPVDTFEQVSLILQWYAARWETGIFFRVLKQDCRIGCAV